MGGMIKIATRLHDGSIHTDTRWTNAFPWWLNHLEMANDNPEHLKAFADNESSYRTGDSRVSPTGYGLIVVDAITHTIYTSNDYDTPGKTDTVMIMNRKNDEPHWQEMRDRGLLHLYDGATNERMVGYFDPETPRDVFEEAKEVWGLREDPSNDFARRKWTRIHIELGPWKVKQFGEKPKQDMLDALIADGWPITDEDRQGWDEWFEYRKEFE